MLIGSGTMDVGELLSYQVGAVSEAGGFLVLSGSKDRVPSSCFLSVPGPHFSCHPGLHPVLALHSPKPSGHFRPLPSPDLSLVITVPHPVALGASSVSFLPIHRAWGDSCGEHSFSLGVEPQFLYQVSV